MSTDAIRNPSFVRDLWLVARKDLLIEFRTRSAFLAAQATSILLSGRPPDETTGWLRLLLAFDLVFVAACTVAFPYTIEE